LRAAFELKAAATCAAELAWVTSGLGKAAVTAWTTFELPGL
jgi:hypothetical protein